MRSYSRVYERICPTRHLEKINLADASAPFSTTIRRATLYPYTNAMSAMARIAHLHDSDLPPDPETTDVEARDAVAKPAQESTVVGLFKSRAKMVRHLLRWRLRNDEDAQDAAQEVFLRLWRREKVGALKEDASSYMICSVYNAAVDVERWRSHHKPDERVSLEETAVASQDAELGEALFWRDAMHHLVDVLNELPTVTRQVFLLYHVEGASHVDISQRVGLSVRSVERHMARAIMHGKERMKDYLE